MLRSSSPTGSSNSVGRGTVMDAVTPATHAPAGEAEAAAGAGSSGVPSNDEAQVTQQRAAKCEAAIPNQNAMPSEPETLPRQKVMLGTDST